MLDPIVRVVRLSGLWESEAEDCPPGSGLFLNMVLAGVTSMSPENLLRGLHEVEASLGRVRRRRNESRRVDLDLILYGARLSGTTAPLLPHPRFRDREFVLRPLHELNLGWQIAGRRIPDGDASSAIRRVGSLY
jgi:2-amino-4-hydroxy-6-hydroxymethyldihydropteridine diphosphokinase